MEDGGARKNLRILHQAYEWANGTSTSSAQDGPERLDAIQPHALNIDRVLA
jgi:hypothetical protein